MLIGYARVSSNDQDTAAQVAALKAAKCERIYGEQASGGRGSCCTCARWWQSNGTRPLAPTTDVCVRQGSLRRSLIACIRKLAVMLKERNIVVADARSGLIWRRLLSPESGGPAQIPEHVKRSAAQA
jgi:hypothetical protein